jgi:alpha-ribazole phosphatase
MRLPPKLPGATRLVLLRHAEPDAAFRGRCHGRLDVGLSPEGKRQALAVGAALAEEPFAAVYTSPLTRALETAAPIAAAHGLEPVRDERLSELDFGELEGLSYEEIQAARPELFEAWMATPAAVRFPGGEAYADLRARVLAAVAEIRERDEGEAVAVVAHGGVVRAVLGDALGLEDAAVFRLGQAHGGLSIVETLGEATVVPLVNAVLYSRA